MCPWIVDIMQFSLYFNKKFTGVFSCCPCGKASFLQNMTWVLANHASRYVVLQPNSKFSKTMFLKILCKK